MCVHWEIGRDAILIKISPCEIKKGLEDVKAYTQWSSVFSDNKEKIDQKTTGLCDV